MGLLKGAAVSALIPALFLFGCSTIKIVKNEKKAGVSYASWECAAPSAGEGLFAGNIPKPRNCPKSARQKAVVVEAEDNNVDVTKKDVLKRLVLKGLKTGFKLYNWLPMAAGEGAQ